MPVPPVTQLEAWMRRCIGLGRVAKLRGDAPVGALLARNGQVIAEGVEGGRTHRDITFHAEIEAIRQARRKGVEDFSGCVLVTTHEPCIMCSYVIRHHRIPVVVFGLETGEIGGSSSGLPVLRDGTIVRWGTAPTVVPGVLSAECAAL